MLHRDIWGFRILSVDGSHKQGYSIWGSILGPPYLWKPYRLGGPLTLASNGHKGSQGVHLGFLIFLL